MNLRLGLRLGLNLELRLGLRPTLWMGPNSGVKAEALAKTGAEPGSGAENGIEPQT